jgi:hypothetical protein
VGWPCICFCASCEDVATSPVARFIVLVGGCWSALELAPIVCPVLPGVGPAPASFMFAARPLVSQGPANAVPTLKTIMAQLARMSRFVFMPLSLFAVPE